MSISRFRKIVWAHYKKHGRHTLPWRPPSLKLRKGKTNEVAYKILVSEVMLQQTQVERVVPFYKKFIKKFPTVRALARAPLSEVLKAWQGLGYNRRAKMLHQAAISIQRFNLWNLVELEKLPGVGPYTARAIAAFAFNQDTIFVETNIRTAVTYHFFRRRSRVADTELVEVLAKLLPKGRSREWYSALMDYGAYLKRSGIRINAKNLRLVQQKPFRGSGREVRGAIVRELSKGNATKTTLVKLFNASRRAQVLEALDALRREGLVRIQRGRYALPV